MTPLSQADDAMIDAHRAGRFLDQFISRLRALGPLRRVLLAPPDRTRSDSGAGELTVQLFAKLSGSVQVDILPATGTHRPMSDGDIAAMYPGIPRERFRSHDHEHGLHQLGVMAAAEVRRVSHDILRHELPVLVNPALVQGGYDRVISIGQLVPHEVVGIANHYKNILIGLGGRDLIDASHYLGAVFGMERIMGRAHTPVRALLELAAQTFLADLPISYLLTVRQCDDDGMLSTRGLFAGDDNECYLQGATQCRKLNLFPIDRPARKVIAWMDPEHYQTGWVANKAIYRTRMAVADGGELIVLAPGVFRFGENDDQEHLIRKHGFHGTPATLAAMRSDPALARQLGVVAHLIHGSSEGRFRVTYCPGHLGSDEITGVGFQFGNLGQFDACRWRTGWQSHNGEESYFVRNPGQGLWGTADKFALDRLTG